MAQIEFIEALGVEDGVREVTELFREALAKSQQAYGMLLVA